MLSENGDLEQEEVAAELHGIVLYKNGKIVRRASSHDFPLVSPNGSPLDGVASKDVMLDAEKNIWVRIYLPQATVAEADSHKSSPEDTRKLPIFVFFHGGAFVMFSAATSVFDSRCRIWSTEVGAMVISVEHRLAPEHRLPAAYDDGYSVIKWLQGQASSNITPERWLHLHADFSSRFLIGVSSGATIAHQVALRMSCGSLVDTPVSTSAMRIRGIILVVPFLGGIARTSSEIACANDDILTLHDTDIAWMLSLPPGASRDHHFCNPIGPNSPDLSRLNLPPYLFVVGGKDLLHDRQMMFVEALRNSGKNAQVLRYDEWGHYTPFPAADLMVFVKSCLSNVEAANE